MLPPPSFDLARRRVHRKRQGVDAPPVPPTDAQIVSVTNIGDGFSVRIVFNVEVTTDGSDIPQFIIETYEGPQSLSGVFQSGANAIEGQCADGLVDGGQGWSIAAAPSGLTFEGGLPFALPQSGTVEAS